MIWTRKDIYCRQVPINHWDVTALITELTLCQRKIFIVSVYIPFSQKSNKDRASLQLLRRLELIRFAFVKEKRQIPELKLILTGNLN